MASEMRWTMFVVRHGETLANVHQLMQGHTDGSLTETGYQQAAMAAIALKSISFQHVFTSDLQRAKKTAEIITASNPNNPSAVLCEGLRERYFGACEDLTYEEYFKKTSGSSLLEYVPAGGGESIAALVARIKRAMADVSRAVSRTPPRERGQAATAAQTPHGGVCAGAPPPRIPHCAPPAAQTWTDESAVCRAARDRSPAMAARPNVLVVTHGGFIANLVMEVFVKELRCQLPDGRQYVGEDTSGLAHGGSEKYKIPNTAISVFHVSSVGDELREVHCVKLYNKDHLQQM